MKFAEQVNEFDSLMVYLPSVLIAIGIWKWKAREKTKSYSQAHRRTHTGDWKLFQCVVRKMNGVDQLLTIEEQKKKALELDTQSIRSFLTALNHAVFLVCSTPHFVRSLVFCCTVCNFDKIRASIYYHKNMISEYVAEEKWPINASTMMENNSLEFMCAVWIFPQYCYFPYRSVMCECVLCTL